MIEFGVWVAHARRRATVRLMDGREATLVSIRKAPRTGKVMLGGRHYNIWVEDIALVKSPEGRWLHLDFWTVDDLSLRPGVNVATRASSSASKNWLQVKPNPAVLHPSFQPGPQRASTGPESA